MCRESNCYLRRVRESDIDILFTWANDKVTRENSFNKNEIKWEDHVKWFSKLIQDPNRILYIYCNDECLIGQVRLDLSEEKKEAEISYSIGKDFRGLGHAKTMLALLMKKIVDDHLGIERLIAKVLPDNIASQKCLMDLGYKEECLSFISPVNKDIEIPSPKNRGGIADK